MILEQKCLELVNERVITFRLQQQLQKKSVIELKLIACKIMRAVISEVREYSKQSLNRYLPNVKLIVESMDNLPMLIAVDDVREEMCCKLSLQSELEGCIRALMLNDLTCKLKYKQTSVSHKQLNDIFIEHFSEYQCAI